MKSRHSIQIDLDKKQAPQGLVSAPLALDNPPKCIGCQLCHCRSNSNGSIDNAKSFPKISLTATPPLMALFATLSLLVALIFLPLSYQASPGWVRLSLTGPKGIDDINSYYYYVNDVLVGTPPATESLVLNLQSSGLAVSSDDCVFCPGIDLFNPQLSSTYNSANKPWPGGTPKFNGIFAQDTISFGSVLTSKDTPFDLIKVMSQNLTVHFLDGHFGLFVNSSKQDHILTRLHSAGQLLNPVVGFRFADYQETSHITIGALDPNEYDGTINWVQAETPDPTWDGPAVIKIDGFRGFNGSFLPYENPILSYLDTMIRTILVPNDWTYMSSRDYAGPAQAIYFNPFLSFACNMTKAYAFLSVDINGVNYQIDSQDNLIRNHSAFAPLGFCNVGIHNLTSTSSVKASLGLPFLRSVYMAYRFPTNDCPNAYYGFAFPKGANRTSSMISQNPRETPSASAQCLSLATPTSTPTVSTSSPQASADQFWSRQNFKVWPEDNGKQVRLRGQDELFQGSV